MEEENKSQNDKVEQGEYESDPPTKTQVSLRLDKENSGSSSGTNDIPKEEIDRIIKENPMPEKYLDLTKKESKKENLNYTVPNLPLNQLPTQIINIPKPKTDSYPQVGKRKPEAKSSSLEISEKPEGNKSSKDLANIPSGSKSKKKIWIILAVCVGMILLVDALFIGYSFSQKDFGTQINLTNTPSDINNNYENTFPLNNTFVINFNLNEELNKTISDAVKSALSELNLTNSS